MPTWAPLGAFIISLVSLAVSVAALSINFQSQLERRHGEIAKLHAEYLAKLDNFLRRIRAVEEGFDTIRLERRLLPQSPEKYESIEDMPKMIADARSVGEDLVSLRKKVESVDTRKINNSGALMSLQTKDSALQLVERNIAGLEGNVAKELAMVRAQITEVSLSKY